MKLKNFLTGSKGGLKMEKYKKLGKRKLQILALLSLGYRTKHVGEILNTKQQTVTWNIAQVYKLLSCNTREQAIYIVLQCTTRSRAEFLRWREVYEGSSLKEWKDLPKYGLKNIKNLRSYKDSQTHVVSNSQPCPV